MTALRILRIVALLEGLSFVLLLFVAMPLKYAFAMPLAVRIAGSIHGLLFMVFISSLVRVAGERQWPTRRSAMAFIAALLPFGPFLFDRTLKHELSSLGTHG